MSGSSPIGYSEIADPSIGRDNSIVLVGPSGSIAIPNVTEYEMHPVWKAVSSLLMNSVELRANLPSSWEGGFTVERGSPIVDILVNGIETLWWNTGQVWTGQLYQYTKERETGALSSWQFAPVQIMFPNLGTWKGDALVSQRITIWAQRRQAL